jgi:hypothetical protein
MNKNQALTFIKQILDAAIKSGVIITMEQASALIQAYTIIQSALIQKNDSTGD